MSHPLYSTLSSEIGFLLSVVCLLSGKSRMEWYRSKPARDKGGEINPKAILMRLESNCGWRSECAQEKELCYKRKVTAREQEEGRGRIWIGRTGKGQSVGGKKQRQEERRGCGERERGREGELTDPRHTARQRRDQRGQHFQERRVQSAVYDLLRNPEILLMI